MAEEKARVEALSVGFFVGVMTVLYGSVLVPFGVYELLCGHGAPSGLCDFHPTLRWTLLLVAFGTFYVFKYRPRQGENQ